MFIKKVYLQLQKQIKYASIKITSLISSMSFLFEVSTLTLPAPIPDNDKKLSQIFICTLLCGASKRFYEGLKALRKNLNKFLFQYNFPKCTG